MHALIEGSDVQTGTGNGVGEKDQFRGAAGGASGRFDSEDCSCIVRYGPEGLARLSWLAGEDGDLAMLDVNFDSAPFLHEFSLQETIRPAAHGSNCGLVRTQFPC